MKKLSPRELTVLQLIANGCSNAQTAKALQVSLGSVENHLRFISLKMQTNGRAHAVAEGFRKGLIK